MDLKKLQAQLINHEGLKLKPYKDTVGKLTIGVGHNLTDKGLTKSQAMSLLIDDITETVNFLTFKFKWFIKLDDVRQRALTNLVFNIGGAILQFHHMLDAIENGEWDKAADGLLNSLYAKQVGKRAIDLAHMLRTGTDL